MFSTFNRKTIWNLPNLFTFSRLIIAFLAVYFIFAGFCIVYIVAVFIIGMLTDVLDGQTARRLKLETEFGRRFDIVADRFLMAGVALAVVIKFGMAGILERVHLLQIFFILAREILSSPFALIALIAGAGIPRVRFIGKLTTVLQGITFPLILLGTFYKFFSFSLYFAVLTGIVGIISAFYYIRDIKKLIAKKQDSAEDSSPPSSL